MQGCTAVRGPAADLAGIRSLPELGEALSEQIRAFGMDLDAAPDEEAFWKRVREEFMLNPGLIHLNCGSLGATPRVIVDALCGYIRALERDPVGNQWWPMRDRMDEVMRKAAEFLGADYGEVALTRNTTEGMNAVATGIELHAGDEVLTTNHEHAGGLYCWEYLARYRGVRIVKIEWPVPAQDKDQFLQLVDAHITPRTRVCSFCHVDTITGMQLPLADIARITRPRDILLVCDGAQAPGMLNVDVKGLSVDTYASSSHKWMLAPKGSGLLYVRKEVKDRVHPIFQYYPDSEAPVYRAYSGSTGTRDVPHILAHGDTMDFHNTIGRDRVEARCRQLNAYLRQCLSTIPFLRPLTPSQPELSSGIVTFAVEGGKISSRDVYNHLKEHHIAVRAHYYDALRFSTHILNSEAEIDRAADVIAEI